MSKGIITGPRDNNRQKITERGGGGGNGGGSRSCDVLYPDWG